MFRSLRAQLGVIFLGFILLVGGSVGATFLAVHAKSSDAVVINLAGRQRMLTQKMTWLALAQPDSPELTATIQLFEQTLPALLDGGSTLDSTGRLVYLPPAPDPELRAQLDTVAHTWADFRAYLDPVDAFALQSEAPVILAQLDSVVSAYEARAQAKLLRLQIIQLTFFVAALVLLAWGYALTRRSFAQPLTNLNIATRRIAGGQLDDPLPILGDNELGELGRAFETMRTEIAAARDHLESRVSQRTRELASAFEFSQEIVAQRNLSHLLGSVTDRARALTGSDAASLCLLDEGRTALILAASSERGDIRTMLRQPLQHHFARRVIEKGETVTTDSACTTCGFLRVHAPGQCIAAPLRTGETTIGALCVVRSNDGHFDSDETRALTLLANSAAIAIANTRLAEAEQHQARQAATLMERERLAAELHDHLAQTLSFLNLKTDQAQEMIAANRSTEAGNELNRMKSAISGAYGQVRAALVGLREPISTAASLASKQDLAEKITDCVENFREVSGLSAELIITDRSALALSHLAQAQAAHIVREALNNVRRHAQAHQVWVRIGRVNDEALFTVKDDGDGFDPQAIKTENHLGLAIMRARAERSGGVLAIESAPGAGTKVLATFPLAGARTNDD